MAESYSRGHKIYFDEKDQEWKFSDNNEKAMLWEDVPDSWLDRCSGDGYKRYTDENGDKKYTDNNKRVDEMGYRPCAKCGQFPINDGEDFCLHHLGKVLNACCGHGTNKGYIQFDNGVTIRGYFEIEYDKNFNKKEE